MRQDWPASAHWGFLPSWGGSLPTSHSSEGHVLPTELHGVSHSLGKHQSGSGSELSGHPQGFPGLGQDLPRGPGSSWGLWLFCLPTLRAELGPSWPWGWLPPGALNNQLCLHHQASHHFPPCSAAGACVSQKPAFQSQESLPTPRAVTGLWQACLLLPPASCLLPPARSRVPGLPWLHPCASHCIGVWSGRLPAAW